MRLKLTQLSYYRIRTQWVYVPEVPLPEQITFLSTTSNQKNKVIVEELHNVEDTKPDITQYYDANDPSMSSEQLLKNDLFSYQNASEQI